MELEIKIPVKVIHCNRKKYSLDIQEGDCISVYGTEYKISICQVDGYKGGTISCIDDKLCITMEKYQKDMAEQLITLWCKKVGKIIFAKKLEEFSNQMDVSYHRFVLKDQKTCWGSCSSKNNLNFNWRLLLMPPEIMDYVIVHELSHLVEMNHSQAFWRVVEQQIPDYKEKRKWLKEHGNEVLRK
ncbi:MAG: M48 family metallopeptidase [Eubacteriales bacterium]